MSKDKINHVAIHTESMDGVTTEIFDAAAAMVRLKFNPSGLPEVEEIKTLAAALISRCMAIRDANDGQSAREASVAITHIQTASMFAVAAATVGL